jgi:hypothetical protein
MLPEMSQSPEQQAIRCRRYRREAVFCFRSEIKRSRVRWSSVSPIMHRGLRRGLKMV